MTVATEPTPPSDQQRPARRRPRVSRVAFAVLVAIGLSAGVYWRWFDTYHLVAVQPGVLYRDGHQTARAFENALDRVRPKTVVSLVDENEVKDPAKPQFSREAQVLAERGIRLEHIPVKLGGYPTTEDVRRFLDVATKPENQPVLVHCAQGVRRTGMMVAAYQMSAAPSPLDREQAKKSVETFGHSDRTTRDVRNFIDVYDPGTRTVTKTLAPTGRE